MTWGTAPDGLGRAAGAARACRDRAGAGRESPDARPARRGASGNPREPSGQFWSRVPLQLNPQQAFELGRPDGGDEF